MAIKSIITVIANGPLQVEGDFRVYDTIGRRRDGQQGKVKLCRCGQSNRKPICDGSHEGAGFKDACQLDTSKAETLEETTTLIISCRPDGMLVARGPMSIIGPDGKTRLTRNKAALCRCGASRNKPFCDLSHKKIGFEDDALKSADDELEEKPIVQKADELPPDDEQPADGTGEDENSGQ